MPAVSQQWPPQQPEQSQSSGPYGPPQDPGQYGPLSSYGQGGQYGQYGPPSQGGQYGQYGPPSQGYPQQPGPQGEPPAPAYPTYPPAQPGPPSQYPPQYPPQYPSGPYPPAGYPGGYGAPPSYGMPPAPKPSRGWVVPLLVVLIVVILAGGGAAVFALSRGGTNTASGTPTATANTAATATPSAPAGFKLYTDTGGVYSLDVPQDWTSTGSSELTTFLSSALPGVVVEIEYLTVPLNGQQDSVAASFFSAIVSTSHGTVTNRKGPTSVPLAGETWSQYSADVSAASQTEHLVLLLTGHAGGTALIAYLAPKDSFSSDDSQYFRPMVNSFTFLK